MRLVGVVKEADRRWVCGYDHSCMREGGWGGLSAVRSPDSSQGSVDGLGINLEVPPSIWWNRS